MSDWLRNLPILWMTVVVFGLTYLMTTAIQGLVTALAKGERARAFKAISTGMLSPLAIIFGLFVVFTAAQVWNDNERANAAVDREASALRAVVLLAAAFPGDSESKLRALVRSHIEQVTTQEWPMMARGTASLRFAPPLVAEALRSCLLWANSGHWGSRHLRCDQLLHEHLHRHLCRHSRAAIVLESGKELR